MLTQKIQCECARFAGRAQAEGIEPAQVGIIGRLTEVVHLQEERVTDPVPEGGDPVVLLPVPFLLPPGIGLKLPAQPCRGVQVRRAETFAGSDFGPGIGLLLRPR